VNKRTLKWLKAAVARMFARKRSGAIVEAPPEPGRFFVMFPDDGVSPGKLVMGTDFREDLPREIERAEEQAQEEGYVDALKRSYVWFDEQEKRRED
jgi:hypothetical protein